MSEPRVCSCGGEIEPERPNSRYCRRCQREYMRQYRLTAKSTTLRDKFAGQAMQGLVSNTAPVVLDDSFVLEKLAARAYLVADAMLEARIDNGKT